MVKPHIVEVGTILATLVWPSHTEKKKDTEIYKMTVLTHEGQYVMEPNHLLVKLG